MTNCCAISGYKVPIGIKAMYVCMHEYMYMHAHVNIYIQWTSLATKTTRLSGQRVETTTRKQPLCYVFIHWHAAVCLNTHESHVFLTSYPTPLNRCVCVYMCCTNQPYIHISYVNWHAVSCITTMQCTFGNMSCTQRYRIQTVHIRLLYYVYIRADKNIKSRTS